MAPGWQRGARMEKRLHQAEEALCQRGGMGRSGALLPAPASAITVPPALPAPKTSLRPQVPKRCFLSPPRDGARGSRPPGKHSVSSPPKRGTRSTKHGPQARTRSKTAPFGGSKTTPRPGHARSSQTHTCRKSKQATGSAFPFPPPPCETPAGTAQPVNPITQLGCGRHLRQGWLTPGLGRSLPQNCTWFPQGAGAPRARGDADFASDCGRHQCSEFGRASARFHAISVES